MMCTNQRLVGTYEHSGIVTGTFYPPIATSQDQQSLASPAPLYTGTAKPSLFIYPPLLGLGVVANSLLHIHKVSNRQFEGSPAGGSSGADGRRYQPSPVAHSLYQATYRPATDYTPGKHRPEVDYVEGQQFKREVGVPQTRLHYLPSHHNNRLPKPSSY